MGLARQQLHPSRRPTKRPADQQNGGGVEAASVAQMQQDLQDFMDAQRRKEAEATSAALSILNVGYEF